MGFGWKNAWRGRTALVFPLMTYALLVSVFASIFQATPVAELDGAHGLMVWTAPSSGIAMCHVGAVKDQHKGRSRPSWMLQQSGSILPSLFSSFTGWVLMAP
jgi:hypothetical protein